MLWAFPALTKRGGKSMIMEASMHGRFDKPAKIEKPANRSSVSSDAGAGLLIFPIFVLITLIVLAIIQPVTSNWIAEAVQAEFAGDVPSVPFPTQLAQPAGEPQSTTSNWIARVQTAWRGQR